METNSSAYRDRLTLEALKLIDAATRGEAAMDEAGEALWKATRRYGGDSLDPVHVAQRLADLTAQTLQLNPNWREILDRQLDEVRLILAAEIPDLGE